MKAREPRRRVMVAARMRTEDGWSDVLIRNISSRGALIETGTTAPRDKFVEVRTGHLVLVGRVAWRNKSQFGIQTQDKVNIDAVAQRPSTPYKRDANAPAVERRAEARTTESLAWMAERSKMIASSAQYIFLAVCIALVVSGLAWQAYAALSKPMDRISEKLAVK